MSASHATVRQRGYPAMYLYADQHIANINNIEWIIYRFGLNFSMNNGHLASVEQRKFYLREIEAAGAVNLTLEITSFYIISYKEMIITGHYQYRVHLVCFSSSEKKTLLLINDTY